MQNLIYRSICAVNIVHTIAPAKPDGVEVCAVAGLQLVSAHEGQDKAMAGGPHQRLVSSDPAGPSIHSQAWLLSQRHEARQEQTAHTACMSATFIKEPFRCQLHCCRLSICWHSGPYCRPYNCIVTSGLHMLTKRFSMLVEGAKEAEKVELALLLQRICLCIVTWSRLQTLGLPGKSDPDHPTQTTSQHGGTVLQRCC